MRPAASADPNRARGAVLALAALPLALLGCGGSGGEAAYPTSSSAYSSVSTSTSAPPTTSSAAVPTASASTSPPAASATSADTGRLLQITISGRRVSPPPAGFRLAVGEKLTVTVTSDVANEVHFHGWDVERELKPNQPTTVELVGRDAGTYEVETHEPELLLTKITVR